MLLLGNCAASGTLLFMLKMPNYEMKFAVSEVARIFNVNRDIVKTWAYHFSEYLTQGANPAKGIPRIFSVDDLRVFAYVFFHWEDDPDIESIKIGLNTDDHFEKPFNDLVGEATPIFQAPPDNLDESWRHGCVIAGRSEIGDQFNLAESYKLAGDMLVDAALSNDQAFELAYPVIYNYRHATELYLKSIVLNWEENHNLLPLLLKFKDILKSELNTGLPQWFENIITAFNDFDPNSTSFRYGGFKFLEKHGEVWVDLKHLKMQMGWLSESFQKIKLRNILGPGL
jgi:hypothetical protein